MNSVGSARAFIVRVWNTGVFWTWMVNAFRLASSIVVLPILLRVLTETDFSMYGQFVALAAIGYTLDGMFATTVARLVSYATRGVADIQAVGLDENVKLSGQPNYVLLGQLFSATKQLYRIISGVILILLGVVGTLVIHSLAVQTSNPTVTWWAWGILILGSCLELYSGYWLVFLRGLNHIVLSARLGAVVYGLKLLLITIFLLAGLGLLAVPVATLLAGILLRVLARRFIRNAIPEEFRRDHSRDRELIRKIWPTSWRLGLVAISYNVLIVGFGAIITNTLGADRVYVFQFSHMIMHSICAGMAAVWTFVKWPMVMQLRVAQDFTGLRNLLWPRLWLHIGTFLFLAALAVVLGEPILEIISPSKKILPVFWLSLLAIQALLEINYAFWTTLLTSENRIPSLWAAVATNLASLALGYILVKTTDLGLGAFVLAPLLTGLAFNYWYWPHVGARLLGTGWFAYMFRRPSALTR